jgi:serine/threonine protein kinase
MVVPQIEGLQILDLIGEGACGSVFIAQSTHTAEQKKWVTVRVFNSLAVNLPLIDAMLGRLHGAHDTKGIIPLRWVKSQQGSLCLVMPLLGELHQTQDQPIKVSPRTLQKQIEEQPQPSNPWATIHQIAHALALMHQHRIPHGNLKPGNIFFDDQGEILLTDFAMGHMPGVNIPPFTDALLYASPEQLDEPEGYLSGKGYAWDTYAFGLLAFQLLTGKLPQCESTQHKITPVPRERQVSSVQADVIRLTLRHEQEKLTGWPEKATEPRERKLRQVIQRCLELDPESRYSDLSEVLHAWQEIETESEVREVKTELQHKTQSDKTWIAAIGALAVCGLIGCGILATILSNEKNKRALDQTNIEQLNEQIDVQKADYASQLKTASDQIQHAHLTEAQAERAQLIAEAREAKHREQLISLGVANDHLLAWMMRDHSKDLPELQKSGAARDTLVGELQKFLKLTESNDQFQPVRARIMMQLAELEIHKQRPEEADQLLDSAVAAWTQAGIQEPGHNYRIARARLACLMQALDQQKNDLAASLLPKARKAAQANASNEDVENKRLNAVMHIIDGRMTQTTDPAKALEHFQNAIQDMQGIQRTLTEHILVKSDLARYTLEAATLAEALDRVDDASRLRGEAATALEQLLKKHPNLQLPKIQLAKIHIMAATEDIREGNDKDGAKKLSQAEQLLATLPATDTSPDGVAMQIAATKSLRAVLLRDSGNTTGAQRTLGEAIELTEKIVAAQGQNSSTDHEPLYRLAVLHWQLAGMIGDGGNSAAEIKQGNMAAKLMQDLLEKGAGKHDSAIRRGLGYLYGDLGHTAAEQNKPKDAAAYFNQAAEIWQSLITKYGKQEEFEDGLKWSQSRAKELNSQ